MIIYSTQEKTSKSFSFLLLDFMSNIFLNSFQRFKKEKKEKFLWI